MKIKYIYKQEPFMDESQTVFNFRVIAYIGSKHDRLLESSAEEVYSLSQYDRQGRDFLEQEVTRSLKQKVNRILAELVD